MTALPDRKMPMKPARLLLPMIVLVGLCAAIWWYLHRPQPGATHGEAAEPPQVVSDYAVRPMRWQSTLKAFGQMRAVQGADLSAQVPGIVDEIDFQSGQEVKAGTVLVRLRLYDDPAKLAQLNAEVALWTANLARDNKQFEAQAVSRATVDTDIATLRSYQAQAAAQSQAMDEKTIRAPYAGKLGIRQVDLGQYLPAGTPITSLQSLDPIYVDFNVAQQQIGELHPGGTVELHVDSWPDRRFTAEIIALDSRIDPASRMVSVRASLANADHALLPGMFATVRLDRGGPHEVLAVPQGAVSFNPYGNFVYVLTPLADHPGRFVAHSRVVTTGEARDDMVVVTHGLKSGETIVGTGQLKLRDGSIVEINDTLRPAAPFSGELTDE
jgi:membrane fusion protein, multidrug efflux system